MTESSSRALKVFLCHSSGDKAMVRELYRQLTAEEWIDPWLDEMKLLPGQEWDIEIEKAVEEADIVLVCLSSRSVDKEGYIQKELRFVLNIAEEKPEGSLFVIPLRLDDCIVLRRLKHWHWVDYFPESQKSFAYKRLLESFKVRARKLEIYYDKPKVKSTPKSAEKAPQSYVEDKAVVPEGRNEEKMTGMLVEEKKSVIEIPKPSEVETVSGINDFLKRREIYRRADEKKIRVVIVDDITVSREKIRKLLQFESDVEVIGFARTGKEAIQLSQELNPDVVLMDINMPDMDGIVATEVIRTKQRSVDVIIVSTSSDQNYMRRAMLAGARDFLVRPVMKDELISAIRRAAQKR